MAFLVKCAAGTLRQSPAALPNRNLRADDFLFPQPVKPRRGASEKIGLFRCRGAACEPLERVEQHRIAARTLVDRKVALEHAAVGAEILDAGLDIGPPCAGHLARR